MNTHGLVRSSGSPIYHAWTIFAFLMAALLLILHASVPVQAAFPGSGINGKIAFTSNRHSNYGDGGIYLVDPDGSHVIKLTGGITDDAHPAWSSDGKRIAYDSFWIPRRIRVINIDGSGVIDMDFSSVPWREPAWSPDGTKIASSHEYNSWDIFLMDVQDFIMGTVDLSSVTRLTALVSATDGEPAWSPDGTKLAFTSDRDANREIYIMDFSGGPGINATSAAGNDGYANWSPDGTKIAFSSDRFGNEEIFIMNPDGSEQTRLTFNDANDLDPAWSPDGTKIAFTSDRDGNEEIYVMNPDGSEQTRVTNNPAKDHQPDWQPAPPSANLTIVKEVVGPTAGDNWSFNFVGDMGSFTLKKTEPEITFLDRDAGTYTITEWERDDYRVTVSCDDGTTSSTRELSITLDVYDHITCTFRNTYRVDSDVDGVDDDIENGAPNNGDGNSDGTPDNQQNHVASLPNSVDGAYATLVSSAGTTLKYVKAIGNPSPGDMPPGLIFPVGFFEFEVVMAKPGDSATVTILLGGNPGIRRYFKYGATYDNPVDHWYRFNYDGNTGAEILSDRVVLHFKDKDRGDGDVNANGRITDPGGPAIPLAADLNLTIVKDAIGVGADIDWSFDFMGDLGPFTLSKSTPKARFAGLDSDTYVISEMAPPGYTTMIDCDNGTQGVGNILFLTLTDEDVTCTFHNAAMPGSITIVKEIAGFTAPWRFSFVGDLGKFDLTNTAPMQQFPGLLAGNYRIAETVPPGRKTQVFCYTGEYGEAEVTVNLEPGEDVLCIFTNTGADIFVSTVTAGVVDGLAFGSEDILRWNGSEWIIRFDGSAAGLSPIKNSHNINAFWIPEPDGDDLVFSFNQNQRVLPSINGKIQGMDLVYWDGSAFSLYFDGSDVGLTTLTNEKIDALHVLPGYASPLHPWECSAYLLVSTVGPGSVPRDGGGTLNFSGEDVLGFCMVRGGPETFGYWTMVLDGSVEGMPRNSTDSISMSVDGRIMFLTTKVNFTVDAAAGGHSMVYAYDMATREFSGPYFRAVDAGLRQKIDGLQVVGELP